MNNKKYDLEERTFNFSKAVIEMYRGLLLDEVNKILGKQLIRSATSIGANYREVNETQTDKDFKFKMSICRKEIRETLYWLQLIADISPNMKSKTQPLIQEVIELSKIFSIILKNYTSRSR